MEPSDRKLSRIHHIQERLQRFCCMRMKQRELTGEGFFACWSGSGCVRGCVLDVSLFNRNTAAFWLQFEEFQDYYVPRFSLSDGVTYPSWYSVENGELVFPIMRENLTPDLMNVMKSIFGPQNGCHVASRMLEFDLELVLGTTRMGRMKDVFRPLQAKNPPAPDHKGVTQKNSLQPTRKVSKEII